MKNITIIISAIILLGFTVVPALADTTNNTNFAGELVRIFYDCQKLKAGMTRAELGKLQMFDQDWGPVYLANERIFSQHTTFVYRSCPFIKVDVDFEATSSKEAQPTDIITKVSMPYLDARPRV